MTRTETDTIDEQTADTEDKVDAVELSLSDLDLVGGGSLGFVFG